jgi:hypothetical protein
MFAGFLVRALLVLLPAFGLALGFAIPLLGQAVWQDRVWAAFTIPVLIVLVYDIVSSLRRGEVGLDIVAAFFDGCRSHRRRGVGTRVAKLGEIFQRPSPKAVVVPTTDADKITSRWRLIPMAFPPVISVLIAGLKFFPKFGQPVLEFSGWPEARFSVTIHTNPMEPPWRTNR